MHKSVGKILHLKRNENVNFETDLEEERHKLSELLKHNRLELKKLYSNLGTVKSEVEVLEIELESISNFNDITGANKNIRHSLVNSQKKFNLKAIVMKRIIDVNLLLKNRLKLKEKKS